jgi:enoyl-CoA hydratase
MKDILKCIVKQEIAIITINKPKVLNALDDNLMNQLDDKLNVLEKDNSVRVVILTGSGEKAFVAGGDIKQMQSKNSEEARQTAIKAQTLFNKIENFNKPVIAAINGYALGGGLELAMACDFRIAAEHAKLGQPEIKIGIIPGFGGTVRLSRIVGKGIAKELIFTGEMIDAYRAYEIGLVNKVVKSENLIDESIKFANSIKDKSLIALKYAKEAINNGLEMDSSRAFSYEADLFGLCFSSYDQKEGMLAFIEKRKPDFKDR